MTASGRRTQPWEKLPTRELLDVRLCDLGLDVESSPLASRVEALHGDLNRAGLRFRPRIWLSTDWFSPDGVPGFAIPFYLAHPRLARLERSRMLQVEGGNQGWCMKLLRHETGHALDHAYRLHRRKRWREVFGPASRDYRATYVPESSSSDFVQHLYNFYAQSHPVEDFAETFAVWLRPGRRWKKRYRGTSAAAKLEYVDALMADIGPEVAPVRSRERTDALSKLRMSLGDFYERKKEHYGEEDWSIYDRDLLRLFSDEPSPRRRLAAAAFLRERRGELRRIVSQWTGQHRFVVDDVLKGMIHRCRELRLRLAYSEQETGEGAAVLLTLHTARILRMRHREYFR